MADALADLLREIENMREERGKLRTKNAALEAELAEEKARNKKLLWQIGEQAHASANQTELHNFYKAISSLTALREAVGEAVERQGHLVRNIENYDRHDMANCIKEIAADLEVAVRAG